MVVSHTFGVSSITTSFSAGGDLQVGDKAKHNPVFGILPTFLFQVGRRANKRLHGSLLYTVGPSLVNIQYQGVEGILPGRE
jgi:hypothetical protein